MSGKDEVIIKCVDIVHHHYLTLNYIQRIAHKDVQ